MNKLYKSYFIINLIGFLLLLEPTQANYSVTQFDLANWPRAALIEMHFRILRLSMRIKTGIIPFWEITKHLYSLHIKFKRSTDYSLQLALSRQRKGLQPKKIRHPRKRLESGIWTKFSPWPASSGNHPFGVKSHMRIDWFIVEPFYKKVLKRD